MEYTFDPDKRESNLKKHGYDFLDAEKVIESGEIVVSFEDNRFNYNELRFINIGPLNDELVVIVTAENNDNEIRIISMRKAEKHDKKIYFDRS